MELRKDFTRLGAYGVTDTLELLALSKTVHTATTPKPVSIVGMVNATRALADGTLLGNICWVDNNAAGGSRFLGTDHLVSAIEAGASVTWLAEPLEVETFVEILEITGPAVELTSAAEKSFYDGAWKYWEGQVPSSAKGEYTYSLSLNICGRAMVLPTNLTLSVTGKGGKRI